MNNAPDTGRSIRDELDQHAYRILAAAALLLIGVATVVYHLVEDWSWVDSIYFSTVAITTVGFGDLAPSTDASKLFTVFYIITGIGVVTAYLNLRFRHTADRFTRRRSTT